MYSTPIHRDYSTFIICRETCKQLSYSIIYLSIQQKEKKKQSDIRLNEILNRFNKTNRMFFDCFVWICVSLAGDGLGGIGGPCLSRTVLW